MVSEENKVHVNGEIRDGLKTRNGDKEVDLCYVDGNMQILKESSLKLMAIDVFNTVVSINDQPRPSHVR